MHAQQKRRPGRRLTPIAMAILIAGSGALAAPSSTNTTKYYYEHAVELVAKGDLRGAVIELKNALQSDPKDLASRVLLGRIYVDLEHGQAAAIELSRARREGAQDSFILVPLGRAYLLQGDYRKVLKEIHPAGQDQGIAAEIVAIRGDAHLALRDYRQAEASYLEASRMRPQDARPLIGLARVKLALDDVEGARNYVRWALQANARDPRAWFIQGEVAELRGKPDEALKSYDESIRLAPEFSRALLSRAAIRIDRHEYDKAEPDIVTVRKFNPYDPKAAYLLSLILSRRGNVKEARSLLIEAENTLKSYPPGVLQSHPPSLLLAGVVTYLSKNFDVSWRLLNDFLKQVPQHKGARKLLASIALMRNEPGDTVRLLDYLNPKNSTDVEVLTMYGDALARLKRYSEANAVLERAGTIAEPGSSDLFRLVVVRLGAGQNEEATRLLKEEMARNPEAVRAAVMLGSAQLKMGEFKAALETLGRVIEREPDNALAHNLAGGAHVGLNDLEAARASYTAAIKAQPDYLHAIENLGKIEVRLGHDDRAAGLFERILEKDARNGKAMIALAAIARQQNDMESAFRWLEKARSSSRDREVAALRLIDLYIGAGRTEHALAVAREVHREQPGDEKLITALGRAQLAAKQLDQAAATFRDLAARAAEGGSADRIYRAAAWQLRARDRQGARSSLEKALAADPRHQLSHLELFKMEIEAGDLDAALARARRMASIDPQVPVGDMLQGDVYMRMGQHDAAIGAYDAALKKSEDTALADRAYHARRAAGREGLDFAQRWAEKRPDEPAAQRLLATAYAFAGRYADAIRIYETLMEKAPGNISMLNNIALLYAETGDPKAVEFAKRAYDAAPTQPATMDTYGWVLVRQGRVNEGLTLLRNARLRAPEVPDIRFHMAVALNALGQKEEAIAELRAALAANQPFEGAAEARTLLAKLAAGKK